MREQEIVSIGSTSRIVTLGAVALGSTVVVVLLAVWAGHITTDADFAVSQVYVELAARGELLLGPYSRFGWHHPGPIFFYSVVPFYVLAGHEAAAMYAAALAINLAALTAIGAIVARESGRRLSAAVVFALLIMCWRAEPFMASPWNAHVAILPALAAIVIAAAVVAGRSGLLPLLATAASFAAQTHVGFAPTMLVVSIAALVVVVVRRKRNESALLHVVLAVLTAAVLWLPVAIDAIKNQGGNVAALWQFFIAEPGPTRSVRHALSFGGYSLASVIRGDFALGWSERVQVLDGFNSMFLLFVTIVLLVAAAARDLAERRRFEAGLAIMAIVATVIGVWGMTRTRGIVLHYDLMRLAAVGALNYGILIGAALRLASTRQSVRRSPIFLGAVFCVCAAVGLGQFRSLTTSERKQNRQRIDHAYNAVKEWAVRNGRQRLEVRIGRDRWGEAASVLARLVRDGRSVAIQDEYLPMFTSYFSANGREDGLIFFADDELQQEALERAGAVKLLEAPPLYIVGSLKSK